MLVLLGWEMLVVNYQEAYCGMVSNCLFTILIKTESKILYLGEQIMEKIHTILWRNVMLS